MQGLKHFLKERNIAIEKRENELKKQERDELEKNKTIVNCQEYCKQHGYPIMHQIHEIICYEMQMENETQNESDTTTTGSKMQIWLLINTF